MLQRISLFSVVLICSVNVLAQSVDRPLVTLSGQAEVMVVPDEVVFNLQMGTLDAPLRILYEEYLDRSPRERAPLLLAKAQSPRAFW